MLNKDKLVEIMDAVAPCELYEKQIELYAEAIYAAMVKERVDSGESHFHMKPDGSIHGGGFSKPEDADADDGTCDAHKAAREQRGIGCWDCNLEKPMLLRERADRLDKRATAMVQTRMMNYETAYRVAEELEAEYQKRLRGEA